MSMTIEVDEYNELTQAQRKLTFLENYGVDNWEGYGEAMYEFWKEEDKHG